MKRLLALCLLFVGILAGCETHSDAQGVFWYHTDKETGCEYIIKRGITPCYELVNGEYEIMGCEDKNEQH